MNDDNELDPVARLRAADPAAEVEPRDGFLENVVAEATLASVATAGDAVTPDAVTPDADPAPESEREPAGEPVPVADLDSERVRRRRRWVPLVAVAASLVIFGSAGYAVGASTGGPGNGSATVADGAAPPISLQGVSGGLSGGASEGAGINGARQPNAAAGPAGDSSKMSAASGVATDMMYPWGYGRNSFSSSGLSTSEGTATGYAFDARAASNAETVSALAAALGVAGTAELKDGSWYVGPQDGSAPSLSVGLDGALSFWFSDPRIKPWPCSTDTGMETGGDTGDGIEVSSPCEQTGDGTVPSEDSAIESLRTFLTAAGRDPGSFEYTTETWEGSPTRTAHAWPVVDGQRIDQAWTIEVASDGILSAYGALADLVPLGDYAVVSEQQAFDRLSDPRFGAQMTALPIAARDQNPIVEDYVVPTEPPAAPGAGTSLSWPVNDVTIVSARLGLASQWQPDGSVLVVPAYEFTDDGGGTWSVIAVTDSKLDFATK